MARQLQSNHGTRSAEIEVRDLRRLKPHPRQSVDFGDLPDHVFAAQVKQIKRRGLTEKIEILPDGTIISGHQRWRALLKLGYREYKVRVRYDLADASDEDVEREFLLANTVRRQLTPLRQVKHALRVLEIDRELPRGQLLFNNQAEACKLIAKVLEISPRNVSRYLAILRCPPAIQRAFESQQMTLVEAGRCALLSRAAQAKLARALSSAQDRAAVKKLLAQCFRSRRPTKNSTAELTSFCRAASRASVYLTPHIDQIDTATIQNCRQQLVAAKTVSRQLLLLRASQTHE